MERKRSSVASAEPAPLRTCDAAASRAGERPVLWTRRRHSVSGSSNVNSAPPSGWLRALSVPPCCSTMP